MGRKSNDHYTDNNQSIDDNSFYLVMEIAESLFQAQC